MKFRTDWLAPKRIGILSGIVFALLAVVTLNKVPESTVDTGASMVISSRVGFASAACLILSGVCLGFALAENFSLPFTTWIDSIYNGGSDNRRPPLDFTQAERYEEEGILDAAIREYERLLIYHPRSVETWRRLISLQLTVGDAEAAQESIAEARHRFRWNSDARRNLEKFAPRVEQKTPGL